MSVKNQANIALTFDLEYWYSGIYLKKYLPTHPETEPEIYQEVIEKILNLLEKYKIKTTFFVLGKLAQENPLLIKKIHQAGHEIAVHGYDHKIISEMTPEQFNQDLKQTKKIIFEITGQEPIGYRAPNFLTTQWLPIQLVKNDIKYDSSIFPFINKISTTNLNRPYYLTKTNNNLIECPIAVYNLYGIIIPVSGGFYFRIIPFSIFNMFLKKILKNNQLIVLYFHPMDLKNFIPKIKIPFWLKIIKYWGAKNSFLKFEKFIKIYKDYQFITLKNIYEKNINHHTSL